MHAHFLFIYMNLSIIFFERYYKKEIKERAFEFFFLKTEIIKIYANVLFET